MMIALMLSLLLSQETETLTADELDDKIRGGLIAQIFGNLNGIPHEFKYIEEPGKVDPAADAAPPSRTVPTGTPSSWEISS